MMNNVTLKRNIRKVLKLLIVLISLVNMIFKYVEYHTAIRHTVFDKELLDKNFYDKIYKNNEEFLLSVINSSEYISNVFKYDLVIAIIIFLLILTLSFTKAPQSAQE